MNRPVRSSATHVPACAGRWRVKVAPLLHGLAIAGVMLLGVWPNLGHPARAEESPNRWEDAIRRFEAEDRIQTPPRHGILFLGSSSIVRWDLKASFPGLPVIQRGFGGSQIADAVHFADRIVIPYEPSVIVFYAGDNDLASGKTPQQVAADYRALVAKVRASLPGVRIVFISIKPSIARWHLIQQVRQANQRIREFAASDPQQRFVDVEPAMLDSDGKPRRELFVADGLHLSAEGYKLWSELVRPHLAVPAPIAPPHGRAKPP